jgi:hypothetical protein
MNFFVITTTDVADVVKILSKYKVVFGISPALGCPQKARPKAFSFAISEQTCANHFINTNNHREDGYKACKKRFDRERKYITDPLGLHYTNIHQS